MEVQCVLSTAELSLHSHPFMYFQILLCVCFALLLGFIYDPLYLIWEDDMNMSVELPSGVPLTIGYMIEDNDFLFCTTNQPLFDPLGEVGPPMRPCFQAPPCSL